MINLEKRINRDIVVGWGTFVGVLLLGYLVEIFRGNRTVGYAVVFMLLNCATLLFCLWQYKKNPEATILRYYQITGFLIMYVFCLSTANTHQVYTYILPILFLLILYHDPALIIRVAVTTLVINLIAIGKWFLVDGVTVEDTWDIEIQTGILILCFIACWMAARIYSEVHDQNSRSIEKLDEKTKQIQRMTFQTIETIANTIDAKDEYTKGHSRRVSDYSAEIAREMGMTDEEVERIRYIALLHDIGKIGVPDAVLNKPGRLNEAEYELMKKHTTIGGEILKDVGMMPELDVGAKYHHERYDGKGYPNGLKGDEIPLVARIICMADSYDAMTSNRIYRKHLNHLIVVEEIRRCRGTQFDPEVTDAFLKFLDRLDVSGMVNQEPEELDGANRLLNRVMEDQTRQLAESSQKDQLTKVYNRSAGERFMTVSMRDNKGFLFYLNIDEMRRINREQGIRMGDFYLLQIVDLLQCMHPDIIVSRFGGDEFLCFIPGDTDQESIRAQMNQLLDGVRFIAADTGGKLTASVGISVHDDLKQTFGEAFAEADKALYYMKQAGKDSFYFYQQVADMEEDLSRQELSNLVEAIRAKDNFSDSMVLGQKDFSRMYDFIRDVVSDRRKKVELVMFTVSVGEHAEITVEQRDRALDLADKAIMAVVRDEDAVCTYSSTQRIVVFVDEDEAHVKEIADEIEKRFYQMYGQHDRKEVITLEYRVASVKED
ncbi:MAG: HD domain-containing protein [Lachnospiraceae bacterium]|nr:HD domain-containing protein [Lachnospiraceae bacterium]